MAFSYVEYQGDGTTTSYTFSFEGQDSGYFRDSDIEVTVDGASASFFLLSSNTLELESAPDVGSTIIIRRVMPKSEPYADFKRGNNFGQDVLNNSFLQLLYVVHELLDGYYPGGFTSRDAAKFLQDLTVDGNLLVKGSAKVEDSDPKDADGVVRFKELYNQKKIITRGYQDGDTNLQKQLTGNVPLEASAFSPISWHKQEIENSVEVPEYHNAWSFGPTMTVSEGQSVALGEGSFWTIANGEVQ